MPPDAPGGASRRGFVAEAALGFAEAVRGDSVFAAFVLIGSTLFLRDVRWDVGAMFLAGACVSRCSWKTRWIVILVMAGVARGIDSDFPVREWSDIDRIAPVHQGLPRYLRVSLLLVAGGAGMRVPGFALVGAALGIAAPLVRRQGVEMSWPLTWGGVSLALAAMGALRLPRAGVFVGGLALVVAGVWNYATSGWTPTVWTIASNGAGVATEFAFVLWPVLAGLAAREIFDPRLRADPVRLLALVQRSPWPALSLVAAFGVLYGGPSFPLGGPALTYYGSVLNSVTLSIGSTLLVSLAAGHRAALGSLAAPLWLSAALVTVFSQVRLGIPDDIQPPVIAQAALATLGPLVLVRAVRDPAPRWVTSRGLPILLALLVVQPAFIPPAYDPWFPAGGMTPIWSSLLLTPIAFQAATCLTWSPTRIALLAALLGAASWLALVAGGTPVSRYDCASLIGVWFLGGVYVVIARRARTFTAVPLDHPIVADHGGS